MESGCILDIADVTKDTFGQEAEEQESVKDAKSLSIRGQASRKSGKRFESRVRQDLENRGLIVSKWGNQVDFKNDTLVPARSKYNPFLKRIISEGSGFPDFIVYAPYVSTHANQITPTHNVNSVVGVESKKSKYLDKTEKKICRWLLDHNVFYQIFIAYRNKKGGIEYYEFR